MDLRILTNDPNYERIKGQRKARSILYVGKMTAVVGIMGIGYGFFFEMISVMILGGIIILAGLFFRIYGSYLRIKYKE